MIQDYSLSYLSALARVLAKLQIENASNSLSVEHQTQLQSSLNFIIKQVPEETDVDQLHVVIEDLTIHCL